MGVWEENKGKQEAKQGARAFVMMVTERAGKAGGDLGVSYL